ncbi:hypothetical protein AB7Z54_10535 [Providencia manganoxydans]|uniref:hypothetical protein n=1 Tax=Providencia manganoxydans TaxID=2923283 RepID=UPI0032DBC5B6
MDGFNWVSKVDWAIVIAILSLLFTTIISFITIRYTKKSLAISANSLDASIKSIDTSILIYEKQKKDENEKISQVNASILKVIKSHVSEEIKINYTHSKGLSLLFLFASTRQNIEIEIEDVYSDLRMVIINADGDEKGFVYANPDVSVIDKYLHQLLYLDENVAEIAIRLKACHMIYTHKMNLLLLYIKNKLVLNDELNKEIKGAIEIMNSYNLLLEKLYEACASENAGELKRYIINPIESRR